MSTTESIAQMQQQAKRVSIYRGLALQITSTNGEHTDWYFTTRAKFEACVNRALDRGHVVTGIVEE